MKLKDMCSLEERQHIKKQRHYFADKDPSSQSDGFSSSHVWMWELDHKEIWAPKHWCFWTMALEKTFESPLYYKEIKPVNPKGNQSWIFIGRTDTKTETPILWPPDAKPWLIGKDHDAGKDWREEEKGMTEDEVVGWHHQLYGYEFEQAPGVGDGQGGLACCSPWGHKDLDTNEWLNCLLEMGLWLRRTLRQIPWVPLEDLCERVPKVKRTGHFREPWAAPENQSWSLFSLTGSEGNYNITVSHIFSLYFNPRRK